MRERALWMLAETRPSHPTMMSAAPSRAPIAMFRLTEACSNPIRRYAAPANFRAVKPSDPEPPS